jgi:ketosteroid isomerase-like protein
MTARSAGELMRAYYAALDAPRLEHLEDLFAETIDWSFPGSSLTTPAQVRRSMERSIGTGLRMRHDIGHLLDQGDIAICELVATNSLGTKDYTESGAVVCEANEGRITRLAAYPRADQMQAFVSALTEAQTAQRRT